MAIRVKSKKLGIIELLLEIVKEFESKLNSITGINSFLGKYGNLATLGLAAYIIYGYLHRKEHAWVNKDYCKSKNKIADIISKSEINGAIEKNEKVAYCRCWKSKTFPYCDGSHAKHNSVTGDNVGPLVFKN